MVEVDSVKGRGSKFTIRIPLTLAIIQALMVRIGDEKYAIPLGSIKEIESVKPGDILVWSEIKRLSCSDMLIPIVRLIGSSACRGLFPMIRKRTLLVL